MIAFARHCRERADYAAVYEWHSRAAATRVDRDDTSSRRSRHESSATMDNGALSGIVTSRAARCSNTWQAKSKVWFSWRGLHTASCVSNEARTRSFVFATTWMWVAFDSHRRSGSSREASNLPYFERSRASPSTARRRAMPVLLVRTSGRSTPPARMPHGAHRAAYRPRCRPRAERARVEPPDSRAQPQLTNVGTRAMLLHRARIVQRVWECR